MSGQSLIRTIFEQAVERLDPVYINKSKPANKPQFEVGVSEDLNRFIIATENKGIDHHPFIWLAPINPTRTPLNVYWEETITLNICAVMSGREVKDMLNKERTKISLEPILEPIWENLKKELKASHQVIIDLESETSQFFEDYKEGTGTPVKYRWDVLQIGFTGKFIKKQICA